VKLQEHEVEEIIRYDLGLDRVRRLNGRKGINFQFCCPFHGETKPSAAVLVNNDGVFGQCFSCKETFGLPKLIAHVQDIEIDEAISYLEEKFNVSMKSTVVGRKKLRRYEETQEVVEKKQKRFELPRVKLAPYRSGKETHKYIFERGFTKKTVKEAMIGWDRKLKRITIPVFHKDGVLAGIIGRAVLDNKIKKNGKMRDNPAYIKMYGNSPKYFIYDNFPIGEVLYGSHEFYSEDDTAIIVEGTLDRLWMKQQGFTNVLSIIIAKMAYNEKTGASVQRDILHSLGVKRVIFMHDNDEAGEVGKEVAYEILKNDFICLEVKYPEDFKDPVGLSRKKLDKIIAGAKKYGRKELRRVE
jgi:DNA primase